MTVRDPRTHREQSRKAIGALGDAKLAQSRGVGRPGVRIDGDSGHQQLAGVARFDGQGTRLGVGSHCGHAGASCHYAPMRSPLSPEARA
jgi:hypothetical protein